MWLVVLIVMLILGIALLYRGRAYLAWTLSLGLGLIAWGWGGTSVPFLFWLVTLVFLGAAAVFGLPALRRPLVTARLMKIMRGVLPRISETERMALEAGTVWWDGELFSGRPDWQKLAAFVPKPLTAEERAFLNGPVEELCAMVDDWKAHRTDDLSPEVWRFMKEKGFFGMIIPREHGGMGFSALAHSAVVTKVAGRSVAAAVTIMVPNSLGPAELILHYGTDEQRKHYLPRLARGEEVPSFALTEPLAGSDAASGHSVGVVAKGTFEGREVLGMRLTWDKRYATLAPVATVLGLAFKLHDPDHLLGPEENLGITCALIPTSVPGVETGRRHDPLGVPFMNGPTTGEDVFVPLDFIIGGPKMAGQGWRMLMESLAAGRSISLPALSCGAVETSLRAAGAYAAIREQFNLAIGHFEGIQDPLARIGGYAYLMNATRTLTAGAVDAGEKPSVLSAMVKAYLTQFMRVTVNDAMDITAGSSISRGPRNILSSAYMALPIGITVEGANILTRSLIIFGQGAIRCHPYVLEEIHSVNERNVARFDRAFFGHMGFIFVNGARSLVLGLSGGRPARPPLAGPLSPYLGELSRMSAAFTFLADISMGSLGGSLKRLELLSGRMADALAWMYIGSATVKRYMDEGHSPEDLPFARYAMDTALFEIQAALGAVIDNYPVKWLRWVLRPVLFPLGMRRRRPSDGLVRKTAVELVGGAAGRERLTGDIYIPSGDEQGLGFWEKTVALIVAAEPAEHKLRAAVKEKRIPRGPRLAMTAAALEAGLITEDEAKILREMQAARDEAVQVDAFSPEEMAG